MTPAAEAGSQLTRFHGYGSLGILIAHVCLAPYGLQDPTSLLAIALQTVFFFLLIFILIGVNTHRFLFFAALFLLFGAALIRFTAPFDKQNPQAIADLFLVTCGSIVMWTAMTRVLQAVYATATLIAASVSLYLLSGIIWAIAFHAVALLQPGSFAASSGEAVTAANLYYFSFVTLATLGYGDIAPITPFAQSLAVLEAVFGQVFLVAMLGRLVSLHINSSTQAPATPSLHEHPSYT